MGEFCGAKTKRPGNPRCLHKAGWGTDHLGTGRCKMHGGLCTGPKTPEGKAASSQNARKAGIYADMGFSADELALVEEMETDTEAVIIDNLKWARLRFRRLMQILNQVGEAAASSEDGLLTVKAVEKTTTILMPSTFGSDHQVEMPGSERTETRETITATVLQVQAEITKIQALEARLLETRTRDRAARSEDEGDEGGAVVFGITDYHVEAEAPDAG